ncbi:MAG: polysaccharide deacetylase family protein [Flavobacteriales bacterium]|nr:polysaccharide deacetylase family protein [Flavobacteriales bacterium]
MNKSVVNIYSEKKTARLQYIIQLIFNELLGLEVKLVDREFENIHINYSHLSDKPGFWIKPDSLLFEEDLEPKNITKTEQWHGLETISINQKPFDVFAASFYLVSRYEEYSGFTPDAHNRFSSYDSCLSKLQLLRKPLINQWALKLLEILKTQNPDLKACPRSFEFISTIDIDQAWKYKHKGFFRTMGGLFRDLVTRNFDELSERISVLTGKREDAFFNFDWQNEFHKRFDTKVQYFFQVGKRGKFDKNTSSKNAPFRELIKRLNLSHFVGIHPSYNSNSDVARLKNEINTLQNILNQPIDTSRQHFLVHQFPKTYQNLINQGIKNDYTLGYTTETGFRAGIASSFLFFDLTKNEATNLRCFPFCHMDITPLHYDQINLAQAIEEMTELMTEVKKVGGLFVSLWHNESLSENGRWKGWRPLYEATITQATKSY